MEELDMPPSNEGSDDGSITNRNRLLDSRNRLLGVIYGIGMNVNNIIGVGIFTTPGIVWKQVKSPYIVISLWVIGGIISLCGSLVYTKLGLIHRESGGETNYLAASYLRPHMMASYLFSFMFILIIRPGIICAVLQASSQYAWYTFNGQPPSIDSSSIGWKNSFSPYWILKLISIVLLLIITVYHALSNRWANLINYSLTIIKMVVIIVVTITALSGILKYYNNSWKEPLNSSVSEFSVLTPYSIAIFEVLFSYNGWNTLNYSLNEFRNPEGRLKLANTFSVGIVVVLYLMTNIAFITAVPRNLVTGTGIEDFNETIAANFFHIIFNNEIAARILSFFVVLSAVGTVASSIWSGSRVIVSAADKGYFPIISGRLGEWNERFNTPVNALFAQFIWCTFLMIVIDSSVTADGFILFTSIAMFSSWIFYIVTGIGLLVRPGPNGIGLPFWISDGIFILSGFGVIVLSFFLVTSPDYLNNISFIIITSAVLVLGCLFWYILFYRPYISDIVKHGVTR